MNITVRPARESDLPILKSFEQGIITAERPFDETLKPDPISYYDIRAMIHSSEAEVAVAEVDDELVASGYVVKKESLEYAINDYHAFIGFLYVAPAYRGKGINGRVLDHLFAWAKAQKLLESRLSAASIRDALKPR